MIHIMAKKHLTSTTRRATGAPAPTPHAKRATAAATVKNEPQFMAISTASALAIDARTIVAEGYSGWGSILEAGSLLGVFEAALNHIVDSLEAAIESRSYDEDALSSLRDACCGLYSIQECTDLFESGDESASAHMRAIGTMCQSAAYAVDSAFDFEMGDHPHAAPAASEGASS